MSSDASVCAKCVFLPRTGFSHRRRRNSGLTVLVMTKAEIAEVLEQIATLLELKDENPFKIRAYANAARSIEAWGGICPIFKTKRLSPKFRASAKRSRRRSRNWRRPVRSNFSRICALEFPAGILELFSIPGWVRKKSRRCTSNFHVSSIAQLQKACEDGQVAELPGFGKTTQEKFVRRSRAGEHAGSFNSDRSPRRRKRCEQIWRRIRTACMLSIAGSYRRRKEIVRDLDFIVATKRRKRSRTCSSSIRWSNRSSRTARPKPSVRLRSGIQCDLRVVSAAEYPFALNYFTGSKEHNIEMRNRALKRGWTLNEYRLAPLPPDLVRGQRKQSGSGKKQPVNRIPAVREEAGLYRALDLDFIPPELRENCGEFEARRKAFAAAADREGEPARHVSLSHHGERRPQLARGNGRGGAGARAAISRHCRSQPQFDPGARAR